MSHFHIFRRTPVVPPALTGDIKRDNVALRILLNDLAQEVRTIHNSIQSIRVTVAGGAASKAVVLPAPHPDDHYNVSVVADWLTTHSISAITTTGFTDTFGIVAPGGGGNLYILLIG